MQIYRINSSIIKKIIEWEGGGGGGGNFHGGKLTPENASQEHGPPEICPHPPKKNKMKIDSRKYYLLGKM